MTTRSDDGPPAEPATLDRSQLLPEDYRTRVRGLLDKRLNRLFRLLALQAPDSIVACEVALIGDVAVMIDPHGMARREGERNEQRARRRVHLCAARGCSGEPADDGLEYGEDHCNEHAAKLRADTAYDGEAAAELAREDVS